MLPPLPAMSLPFFQLGNPHPALVSDGHEDLNQDATLHALHSLQDVLRLTPPHTDGHRATELSTERTRPGHMDALQLMLTRLSETLHMCLQKKPAVLPSTLFPASRPTKRNLNVMGSPHSTPQRLSQRIKGCLGGFILSL